MPSTAIRVRPVSIDRIAQTILLVRGQKVLLDSDIAALYQVETKSLNRAVRRNPGRFPEDFMFQLTREEFESLRYQIGTLKAGRGQHRKYLPFAFNEHGVAMLSSVLNSERAVQMNILIIRAFVKIRELIARNKELANRIEKLEAGYRDHASVIAILAEEINKLKRLPSPKSRPIGFTANLRENS